MWFSREWKGLLKWNKKNVCQASQVFFFRIENQTSKKVADTKLWRTTNFKTAKYHNLSPSKKNGALLTM